MKSTIYDVAELSGVSIATVSKVVNNKSGVSKNTREKVLQVMDQLEYRPSLAARSLSEQKTNTIGLIVPDLGNPYYGEVSKEMEKNARENGYNITICSSNSYEGNIKEQLEILMRTGVDGILIASFIHTPETLEIIEKIKIPIVLFVTERRDVALTTINIDEHEVSKKLTNFFFKKGLKKIALLAEGEIRSSSRIRGYQDAMREAKLQETIFFSENNINAARISVTEKIEQEKTAIEAIIACSDSLAIGTLKALQSKGLNVPDDVQVISFDGTILTEITTPSISSIVQPIPEMADSAVKSLLNEIKGESTNKTRIIFDANFIERNTTN